MTYAYMTVRSRQRPSWDAIPLGDVALLQLATKRPLPVVPLGSSAATHIGELVVAIGSPFGFEHTITLGIVSGKKRQFLRGGLVGGYLQTDAPLTTGNSGGPLVNMRGEVVAMNTAIVGRGEVGLAIPIDAIKEIVLQLHTAGRVTRGWLGSADSAAGSCQKPRPSGWRHFRGCTCMKSCPPSQRIGPALLPVM